MTEQTNDRPTYERFIVEVVVEKRDVPGIVRFRRWLKCGLRGYGLRCTEAKPLREAHQNYAESTFGGERDQ